MNTESFNERETKEIAKRLAPQMKGGMVICLYGELGAGKTTFVKGLAEAFNVKMEVTSPTFTLMNLYKVEPEISKIKYLVHIDTYRMKTEDELIEIGVEDYVGVPDTLTVIEWPDKIPNFLKNKKVMKITFNHNSEKVRNITVEE